MEASTDELSWDKYEDCDDQRATFAGCDAHCAPTETMLLQAEFATITKSRGIFGRNSEPEPWSNNYNTFNQPKTNKKKIIWLLWV